MLLSLEPDSSDEDITVCINSPGESVRAGLAMIDTMDIISFNPIILLTKSRHAINYAELSVFMRHVFPLNLTFF